jgi:hypothetical protein
MPQGRPPDLAQSASESLFERKRQTCELRITELDTQYCNILASIFAEVLRPRGLKGLVFSHGGSTPRRWDADHTPPYAWHTRPTKGAWMLSKLC